MGRLLLLDCDGVLCPHAKDFDHTATVHTKRFSDKDRTGIKLFKARGWTVVMLSGDTNINKRYAEYCEIDFWSSRLPDGTLDKVQLLEPICKRYDIDISDIVFIGDDPVFDGPLLETIRFGEGEAYAPADSIMPPRIARLETKGGEGVVLEVYRKIYGDNYDVGKYNV